MNIPHSLSLVIQRSTSLADILNRAVALVAEEMGTDVCSIYLVDSEDHGLRLAASRGLSAEAVGKVKLGLGEGLTGLVVKEMRPLDVEDASSHPGYRYFPETREERYHSYLGVPLALRNRPVGALVVQTTERRSYTREEVQTLTTIAAQLVGVVENARLVDALDREAVPAYLREIDGWRATEPAVPEEDHELVGSAASPGIAIGPALLRGAPTGKSEALKAPAASLAEEQERLRAAIEATRIDVNRIQRAAERETDEEHALIFSSHLLFLNDPAVSAQFAELIAAGANAARAVSETLEGFVAKLQRVTDPYIQERIEDIFDLESRLIGHITESTNPRGTMGDRIVIAQGIPPSLVVELKAEGARGLVTARGGPTSHGALLARSMGIPAVTGLGAAVHGIQSGERLIIDGRAGKVIRSPSRARLRKVEEDLEQIALQTESAKRFCHVPGRTHDGRRIALQANIGVSADLAAATEAGAEGVGLYRTEFPFLIRDKFPTVGEQVRIYRKVWDHFPKGPARFRLLDIGGDKLLPGELPDADSDPFRGYRSLRLLLDNPDVLQDQVEAFVIAAAGRPLEIMFPMVTTLTELRRARELVDGALERSGVEEQDVRIGAMIEVPAAVELADRFAAECDFLSIGTNDLIQYTLAVARENEKAASTDDPYHPAVLRAIRRTLAAGRGAGIPVTVCGELAGRHRLAVALTAMGINALSLAPGAIPEIKRLLASTRIQPVVEEIDAILELDTAGEIQAALERHLPSEVLAEPGGDPEAA